jgi:hypothetical protein
VEKQHAGSIFNIAKRGFYTPYADILEMPIFGSLKYRFQSNVNNYRHFLL